MASLLRLGVVLHARHVDEDARLLAFGPRVVAGWHVKPIAGSYGELLPRIHLHGHAARDAIAGVHGLTARRSSDGLHVVRPLPAGLEHPAADRRCIAELEYIHLAVCLELASLVRRFETFRERFFHD